MKKKDIVDLINAKEIIKKNSNLLKPIKTDDGYLPEEEWVPNIEKYKEQLNILKNEISETIKESKQAQSVVDNIKCSHEVRLKHRETFGSQYECVICGKYASSDNHIDWFQSIYRNKHTISFYDKYQEDEDGYYIYENGKTKDEVIDMILRILAKYNDEDEIDLVNEFSKISIPEVEINLEPRKEENYILIIGGTNLKYIDPNKKIYARKDYKSSTLDFLNYFSQLLNTKIAIIENQNTLMETEYIKHKKNNSLNFYKYNTIDELNNYISYLKLIPFKVIIDLTDLYDYQIDDYKFSSRPYDLNLKELFPHSQIIKVPKLSSKSLQELKEFLLLQKNTTYANVDKDYYYLNENEVTKTDLEETCQNIKTLLRKKG